MPEEMYKYICVYVLLIIGFIIITRSLLTRKERRILRSIKNAKPVFYEDFEENWIVERQGAEKEPKGYKYEKFPGCYVMLIFEKPVYDGNYSNWDDIYIGQSVNVTNRVHNHFTGKGKGDVYADIKYGRYVYVQLFPCKKDELNDLERALIEVYNATESYNDTVGGAKEQKKKRRLFRK